VAAVAAAAVVASAWLPGVAGGSTGDGFAGSSGEAEAPGPQALAPPPGALPGIDVSHHQDVIDWALVAASGQRFVFAKATEGRTFVDPMYATNKAGAQASGIAFGAYHFAQPDRGQDDAILEADHFVDTALLEPGNLLPVLDIERTNGLSHDEITEWILIWLGRVTERLGVRPIVYTSPGGWDARTGDTTAVAEAGYSVLWVAHWGVEEPRLPAEEWAGHGWTFWQYGNCGSIPGIDGCVDVDWSRSSDLGPVTIPSPDVVPPVVSFSPPADVGDPLTVTFDEVVRGVSAANVSIRVTSTGATLEVATTCRSAKEAVVDCATGNVRTVVLQPIVPLVPGETYEAVVNPVGTPAPVVDRSGNPAPATSHLFAPPTAVEQDSAAVAYAWRTVSNRNAFGGSQAVERTTGATASFAFTGRSVTWYTATGPDQGRAAIRIDGVRRGTFDQYAPARHARVARTFDGLERGPHTIVVRAIGTAAASASDTQVVVDAFGFGGDVVANPALEAAWGSVDAPAASGGSLAASDLERASVTFTFRGSGVEWTTVRDRHQGRASIFVDGAFVRTVDGYAASPTYGVVRSVTGLAPGVHTLRVVVLGEGRPAATGTFVSVDRFVAIG
jgi:GH25 family lysozyme M1 (1,4-beta-N-acetylmuramidase)